MKRYSILIVDDEKYNLDALVAIFKSEYDVLPFENPTDALEHIRSKSPSVDLVLTDQRMPKMTGVEFLDEIKKIYPGCMRLVLTGFSETKDLIDAINKGEVHRYITKPAEPAHLRMEVRQALGRYNLENEKERLVRELTEKNEALRISQEELKKTNLDILKILGTLAAFKEPDSGRHALFVARASEYIARKLNLGEEEILRTVQAAHLHDVGRLGLPDWVLKKNDSAESDWKRYDQQHPLLGEAVLLASERLSALAPIVLHHHEWWNGEGFPDRLSEDAIPLQSRIIAIGDAYEEHLAGYPDRGVEVLKESAARFMEKNKGVRFDPELLPYFMEFLEEEEAARAERMLTFDQLEEGMLLSRNVLTREGFVLIPKGTKLSKDFVTKVKGYSNALEIVQPIAIYV